MEPSDKKMQTACLICKHTLSTRLNIFKTRTNFSKTLVSCKLSRLVQSVFRPGEDEKENPQDICGSCAGLINQVDECEIKLMALENEVKLKFKMPFPIEVHSRRTELQPPSLDTPVKGRPAVGQGGDTAVQQQEQEPAQTPLVQGVAQSADGSQQLSFISLDGANITENAIVLQAEDVDGENVVVYREPYGDQVTYTTNMPSMSYLTQLEGQEGSLEEQELSQEDAEDVVDMVEIEQDGDDEPTYKRPGRPPKRPRVETDPSDPNGYPCDLCGRSYTTASNLRIHKASHELEKSFQCRFCQQEFLTNMALHNHMNENHPLRLLPCPYCDKRFLNKSNLNQHVNTHQEPRFRCEQCPRQFHTRGDLRKHIVFRHTEEKNFPCPDCDQCFKVNWLLTRHKVRCHAE